MKTRRACAKVSRSLTLGVPARPPSSQSSSSRVDSVPMPGLARPLPWRSVLTGDTSAPSTAMLRRRSCADAWLWMSAHGACLEAKHHCHQPNVLIPLIRAVRFFGHMHNGSMSQYVWTLDLHPVSGRRQVTAAEDPSLSAACKVGPDAMPPWRIRYPGRCSQRRAARHEAKSACILAWSHYRARC